MKKILSVMLAILMLAVPVLSMAESAGTTSMTLTFSDVDMTVLGLDEQSAQLVKDVLECIGVRGYALDTADGAQFGLAVTLQGTDAVTADVLTDANGVYVASNFLGQDTVLVTYAQLADMLEAYKGELTAQGMEEAQIDQIVAALRGDMSLADMGEFDLELTNTLTVLEKLLTNNMGEGDPATAPEGCAPAAAAVTVTVSGEEVSELFGALLSDLEASQFIKNFLGDDAVSYSVNGEPSTKEEMLAKVRDSIQGDIVLTIYMGEDGMPVAVTCAFSVLDETGAAVDMTITCLIVADENGLVTITVTANVVSGDDKGVATLQIATVDDNNVAFSYTMVENDEPAIVEVKGNVCVDGDTTTVDVYVTATEDGSVDGMHVQVIVTETSETTCTMQIKYMTLVGDAPFLAINIAVEEMAAVPAIGTADAVQPLTMTEEELNAWVEGLTTTAQMQLMSMIQLLPPSVLSLMLGGME